MTSRRIWGVLLGLVLALAVLAPPAEATVAPTQLSATVTNSNGEPQDGTICLELVGTGSCSGNPLVAGAWSTGWVDAADDPANGEQAGDYLIRVISSTMDNTNRWYVAGNPAGSSVKADATPVSLHSGAPDLAFTMVMPTIATLSGYVKDTGAVGVAGLDVGMVRSSGSTKFVKTDATGRYDFGYTQAKTYPLTVNPNAVYGGTSGTAIVPASGAYQAPDMTVQRAASIHGHLTDSVTGDPLPLILVEIYTAGDHQYKGSAYTDLNGDYRIGPLGNQPLVARYTDEFGGYQRQLYVGGNPVDWSGEVSFTLAAEQDLQVDLGMTATTPTPPAHTLSGTVTDPAGHPLPGIAVSSPDDQSLYGVTDRLGHWYLDAPPGTYRLRLADDSKWGAYLFAPGPDWFPEYYPDAAREAAGTPVTIGVGQTLDNLDVTLERGAFITGSVRETGDPTSTNFGTHWVAYGPSGQVGLEQEFADFFSGADYTALVRPGTWRLLMKARRTPGPATIEYLPRWIGDADSFAEATPITVAPGETFAAATVHLGSGFGPVSAPVVSGTPAVGGVLTASTGTWSTMTLTQYDVTWWRGPTQVGSGASYQVGTADVGDAVRARVVATNGSHTATADSAPVAVGRLASTATGRGTSRKAGTVRLTLTVSAAGLTPAGTLTIKRGARVVKRGVLLVGGRAVVTLKRQPSGPRRFTAVYSGSAQTLPVTSASIRVKVR